jgi:hypothetical protein
MENSIVVLSASMVGGYFVLRVVWSLAVKKLLSSSDYDGIDHGDGTGSIWK